MLKEKNSDIKYIKDSFFVNNLTQQEKNNKFIVRFEYFLQC